MRSVLVGVVSYYIQVGFLYSNTDHESRNLLILPHNPEHIIECGMMAFGMNE